MNLLKELRANQKRFGNRLSPGEMMMYIQSEEKFREDDPLEALQQQERIDAMKKLYERGTKRLMKRLLKGSR